MGKVGSGKLYSSYYWAEHPNQKNFFMHAHEGCELLYFVSGHGTYAVEGNEYCLSPGCILVMRAGETHMIHIEPDTPYVRYTVNFRPEMLASADPNGLLMQPFTDRPLGQKNMYTAVQFDNRLVRNCLEMMHSTEHQSDAVQQVAILSGLMVILFEISRAFQNGNENAVLPQGLIAGVVDYINRNLTENLNLDTLSRQFFLSKSYLNQQFRQATGTTIWDYVLLKRLMLARTSIRGGASVTDAFRASGFNDYSSFYRRYKNRFGVSPKDDRPRDVR